MNKKLTEDSMWFRTEEKEKNRNIGEVYGEQNEVIKEKYKEINRPWQTQKNTNKKRKQDKWQRNIRGVIIEKRKVQEIRENK